VFEKGELRVPEVSRLPGSELEVVLVIDTSGSMAGTALAAAKAAASVFLARIPPSTPVAVVSFSATPTLAHGFSTDRNSIVAGIANLQARGETALYDALSLAVDQFTVGSKQHSLVVLSDGGDTSSALSFDGAAAKLRASAARLDAVALATSESDRSTLSGLVGAGNGALSATTDPFALASIYDGIAATLSNRYRITYRSEAHDQTPVRISLEHDGVGAEASLTIDLPAAPPPPSPRRASVDEDAGAKTWALAAGAVAIFVALVVTGIQLVGSPHRTKRHRLGLHTRPNASMSPLSNLAARAADTAEDVMERRGQRKTLGDALENAGIGLRPGELVVIVSSFALAGFLIGNLVGNLLLALVLGAAPPLIAKLIVARRRDQRRAAFADQLVDTLQLLAGTLRAGYGLMQAVDAVARKADSPTNEEFHRVLVESRFGRDVSVSLEAMARRLDSEDFSWVVQAIQIHREIGGDLAEVLDTVGTTIRERNQLHRQVRALSAEGRLSAYVLMALPFVVGLLIFLTNRRYMSELDSTAGYVILGSCVVLMTIGGFWLKRLCRLVY
jgi:tight adherence protein B